MLLKLLNLTAQRTSVEIKSLVIQQDAPMTNSIRKAFEAGTRDFSVKPGPNYWHLEKDFTIKASLDTAKQMIPGFEKIIIHYIFPHDLGSIILVLDHNVFRGDVPSSNSLQSK